MNRIIPCSWDRMLRGTVFPVAKQCLGVCFEINSNNCRETTGLFGDELCLPASLGWAVQFGVLYNCVL